MRSYDSEDAIIKDLLETNIRQRGTVGGSEKKLTARIYGIRHGSINPKGTEIGTSVSLSNSREQSKTFDQILANEGIDRATYFKAKKLQSLSPEIQQLIEEDKISATTAYRLIAKLSDIEQEQLIQSLPVTERLTQKQVQEYVEQLKTKQDSVDLLKKKYVELQEQLKQATNPEKIFQSPKEWNTL